MKVEKEALKSLLHELEKNGEYGCYHLAVTILNSDDDAREAFEGHWNKEEVLAGIHCTQAPDGIKEYFDVVFTFSCPRGKICLIPPAFRVRWNWLTKKKVRLDDPYLGPWTGLTATSAIVTTDPIEFAVSDVRLEGNRLCGNIKIKSNLRGFEREWDIGRQCIDVGAACLTILDESAVGFKVKVELCYESRDNRNNLCLKASWKTPFTREEGKQVCYPV